MKTTILLALPALLLAACASNKPCGADDKYRQAAAIPPIVQAEGLKLPESAAALKVPTLTPAAVEAARQPLPRKGKREACLEYPPEIAPIDAAPGAPRS